MKAQTLTFLSLTCLLFSVAGCGEKEVAVAQDTRSRVRVCTLADEVPFENFVTVQGNVRTKVTAQVASRLPGTVDALFVDEGDVVSAGQQLFQVDRVNLENQVAIAKDDQVVASAAREEALAAEAEALAALEKATTDEARFARLYESSQAVTKDALEKAQLQLKSATAAHARAKAAVATADAKILQADTARRIAEKNLADSCGQAPFAGTITKKLRERGDFVGAGVPIFTLEDPNVREVCFLLSSEYYAQVALGKTEVETSFGQRLPVTYKAPTVNPVSRTFEIRAVLRPDEAIAPGMLCTGRIVFDAHKGAGLPSSAVGLRGGKKVAFTVDANSTVKAVEVKTGTTFNGMVEVLNPEALRSATIIRDGMLLLNPGDAVKPVQD